MGSIIPPERTDHSGSEPLPFEPGSIVFEKFEMIRRLGKGGMGDVFEVRDINLDKRFALKILTNDRDDTVVRFQNEARITSRLSHPNIATVYDFGVSKESKPYLAIELIEGTSLMEYVDNNGCLSLPQFLDIFTDVAAALECAHRAEVVHRDLKPANIMVTPAALGKKQSVKVLDFGLAKRIDIEDSEASKLTITGQVLGTPLYMSPEQASGKSATSASDLYSLGCVMYFCLAGRPPLKGETVVETLNLHINSKPLPLLQNKNKEDLPATVSALIAKLLNKDPKERFESASQLKAELIAIGENLDSYPKNENLPSTPDQARAGSKVFATLTVAIIAGVLMVVVWLIAHSISDDPKLAAQQPDTTETSHKKTQMPRLEGNQFPQGRDDLAAEKLVDDITVRKIARARDTVKTANGSISRPHLLDNGMNALRDKRYEDAVAFFKESMEDTDIDSKRKATLGLIQCYIALNDAVEAGATEHEYLNFIGERDTQSDKANSTHSNPSDRTRFQIDVGDLYFSQGKWLRAKAKYDQVLSSNTDGLTREELSRVHESISICKRHLESK